VWDGHLESRKNPDRLKRSIHVDRIGVHSTFVYIYAGLRALMIWANCLFSFKMSFLLRKVEDVTTISKSQSLTSVSIKDCTLRVPNETTTIFLLRVIIKAIFILTSLMLTDFLTCAPQKIRFLGTSSPGSLFRLGVHVLQCVALFY